MLMICTIHFTVRARCFNEKTPKFYGKLFEWSHNTLLKSKAGKCNLIASPTSQVEIKIENTILYSVNRVKFLGAYIDGRLYLD